MHIKPKLLFHGSSQHLERLQPTQAVGDGLIMLLVYMQSKINSLEKELSKIEKRKKLLDKEELLFGKKIQVYLKLKNLVEKGKKSGSHPDNKPINKDDDNYDLGRLDAVEHHNPTFKKIIFLRDAKKQLLNSEG